MLSSSDVLAHVCTKTTGKNAQEIRWTICDWCRQRQRSRKTEQIERVLKRLAYMEGLMWVWVSMVVMLVMMVVMVRCEGVPLERWRQPETVNQSVPHSCAKHPKQPKTTKWSNMHSCSYDGGDGEMWRGAAWKLEAACDTQSSSYSRLLHVCIWRSTKGNLP